MLSKEDGYVRSKDRHSGGIPRVRTVEGVGVPYGGPVRWKVSGSSLFYEDVGRPLLYPRSLLSWTGTKVRPNTDTPPSWGRVWGTFLPTYKNKENPLVCGSKGRLGFETPVCREGTQERTGLVTTRGPVGGSRGIDVDPSWTVALLTRPSPTLPQTHRGSKHSSSRTTGPRLTRPRE